MIYINIGAGRLGNQFFCYAFAKQLQINNPRDIIVFNFADCRHKHRTYNDGYENSLRYFKTSVTETNKKFSFSPIQYIIHLLFLHFCRSKHSEYCRILSYRKWVRVLEFFGLYYWNIGYYPFRMKKPWWVKNVIVNGCFECEKYFEDIRGVLLEEFQPRQPIHDYNVELMHIIQNNNSVAVCIRRGDFLDSHNAEMYNVCGQSYFERAIKKIKQRVVNPVFIFFSDDIKWVKNHLDIGNNNCYCESGKDEVWETMRLMSSCKHFIISNSTFHWWAQYLSDNPNKVVIAPNRWYGNQLESALYQDNWELISV